MSYFSKLHSGFSYSLPSDLEKLFNSIPSVLKRIGQSPPRPDYPHWMAYENHTKSSSPWHQHLPVGSIAVTQDTAQHFPRDVAQIIEELRRLWPSFDWRPDGIHFMQTIGHVLPHRGGTRSVSLNIGLKNSDAALTQVAINNQFQDYAPTTKALTTYQMHDGDVYVLNVTYLHSVLARDDRKRYQLTYMTSDSYEEILRKLQ